MGGWQSADLQQVVERRTQQLGQARGLCIYECYHRTLAGQSLQALVTLHL